MSQEDRIKDVDEELSLDTLDDVAGGSIPVIWPPTLPTFPYPTSEV